MSLSLFDDLEADENVRFFYLKTARNETRMSTVRSDNNT
jgi:hypothetical protein